MFGRWEGDLNCGGGWLQGGLAQNGHATFMQVVVFRVEGLVGEQQENERERVTNYLGSLAAFQRGR